MADSPFPTEDSEPGTVEIAEAMVSTLAIERGGLMRIDHDRVRVAAKMAEKQYPNGIHAHFTADDRALQVELVDRNKCTMRNETRSEVATYETSPDGKMIVKDPSEMTKADLESINHAQHILIMSLLNRMHEVSVEVTREEFQSYINANGLGMGALSITKRGSSVYASLLTGTEIGEA